MSAEPKNVRKSDNYPPNGNTARRGTRPVGEELFAFGEWRMAKSMILSRLCIAKKRW